MSNERELLELAARAAGYKYMNSALWNGRDVVEYSWNPLENDGDAFRLAVTLRLNTRLGDFSVVVDNENDVELLSTLGADPYAATRRVIVMAAAEIGRAMP